MRDFEREQSGREIKRWMAISDDDESAAKSV
jgi:hypothetical protein